MNDTQKWDEYGEKRLLTRNRLLYPWHRELTRIFLDYFGTVNTNAKVLEIGCGDGFWLGILRDLGFAQVLGIDLSETMLTRCRAKNLTVEKMDAAQINYQGAFDIIIMNDVLEHLTDADHTLERIRKALTAHGVFYSTVPTCESFHKWYQRTMKGLTRLQQLQQWDETHVQAWTGRDLRFLFTRHGFAIDWMRRVYNPFPWAGLLGPNVYEFFSRFTLGGRFGDLTTTCSIADT